MFDEEAVNAAANALLKMSPQTEATFSAPDVVPEPVPEPTPVPQPEPMPPIPQNNDDEEDVQTRTKRIAKREGVDPKLILAMMAKESSGKKKARSWANAKGYMQVTPDKIKTYYKENPNADPYDAEANITAGVRYMKRLLKRYGGDVRKALAAYNAGEKQALDRPDWEKYAETWSNDKEVQAGRKPRGKSDPTNTLNYVNHIYSNYKSGKTFTDVGYQIDDEAVNAAANALKNMPPPKVDEDAINAAAAALSKSQPPATTITPTEGTTPTPETYPRTDVQGFDKQGNPATVAKFGDTPIPPVTPTSVDTQTDDALPEVAQKTEGITNPPEFEFWDKTTGQQFWVDPDRKGLKDSQIRLLPVPNVVKTPEDKAKQDNTPRIIEKDPDGNYYFVQTGQVATKQPTVVQKVRKVPTKVPVSQPSGDGQIRSPLEELKTTGQTKLGSATVKMVGQPDGDTIKVEDEDGETYKIDAKTGDVEDESMAEVADTFSFNRVPLNLRPTTSLEDAKTQATYQIASQMKSKYGIAVQDFAAWQANKGFIDFDTKGEANPDSFYQPYTTDESTPSTELGKSLLTTNTYSITRREMAELQQFSARQSKAREDAVLQMIASGQFPTPETLNRLEVDLAKIANDRRDDYMMAREKQAVSLEDFDRFKRESYMRGMDDYEASITAGTKLGWYTDKFAQTELENWRKEKLNAQSRVDAAYGGDQNPDNAVRIQLEKRAAVGVLQQRAQQFGTITNLVNIRLKMQQEEAAAKQAIEDRMNQLWGGGTLPSLAYFGEATKNVVFNFGKGLYSTVISDMVKGAVTITKPIADGASMLLGVEGTRNLNVSDNIVYRAMQTVDDFVDKAKPSTNDDFRQTDSPAGFFVSDIPQGVASSLGFLLPSVSKYPRVAIALYSTVGMVSNGYEEAKAAGADEIDAQRYGIVSGGLLGWTEIFGSSEALIRLNRGSGGALWRQFLKKAFAEAAKEVPEEIFQEGVQTIGSNALARLTYDPNRELDRGLGRAMLAAGFSAGLVSTGVTLLNTVRYSRQIKTALAADRANGIETLRNFGNGNVYLYGKKITVTDEIQPLIDKHTELHDRITTAYKLMDRLKTEAQTVPLEKRAEFYKLIQDIAKNTAKDVVEQRNTAQAILDRTNPTKPDIVDTMTPEQVAEVREEPVPPPVAAVEEEQKKYIVVEPINKPEEKGQGTFVDNAADIEQSGVPEPIFKGALPTGAAPVDTNPVQETAPEPASVDTQGYTYDPNSPTPWRDFVESKGHKFRDIKATSPEYPALRDEFNKLKEAHTDIAPATEPVQEDPKPMTPRPTQTQTEYIQKYVGLHGDLFADAAQAAADEHYAVVKEHVKNGGTITKKVYDSMQPRHQRHFDQHYNSRGDKITANASISSTTATKPYHVSVGDVIQVDLPHGTHTMKVTDVDGRMVHGLKSDADGNTVKERISVELGEHKVTNLSAPETKLGGVDNASIVDDGKLPNSQSVKAGDSITYGNQKATVVKVTNKTVVVQHDGDTKTRTIKKDTFDALPVVNHTGQAEADQLTHGREFGTSTATPEEAADRQWEQVQEEEAKSQPVQPRLDGVETKESPENMEPHANGATPLETWAKDNPDAVRDIDTQYPAPTEDEMTIVKLFDDPESVENWEKSPAALLKMLQKHDLLDGLTMSEVSDDLKEDLKEAEDAEERQQMKLDYITEQLGYESNPFGDKYEARWQALYDRYTEIYNRNQQQGTATEVAAEEAPVSEEPAAKFYEGDEVTLKDGTDAVVSSVLPDGKLEVEMPDGTLETVPISSVKPQVEENTAPTSVSPEASIYDHDELEARMDQLYKDTYLDTQGLETMYRLLMSGQHDKLNELLTLIETGIAQTSYMASEKQLKNIKGKVTANIRALLRLIGEQMYKGDIVEINVKEAFQNSFDAVKAAVEKGLITNPQIKIALDQSNRTLTVTDNGIGMNKKIILESFLVIAGSSKENTDPSGGFGMAKAPLLFGNDWVDVTTIRDGVKYTFRITPEHADGNNVDIKQEATTEPSGTTLIMRIPEKVQSTSGDEKDVWLPYDLSRIQTLSKPLLGDVEVLAGDSWGGETTWKPITTMGKHFDYSQIPKFTSVNFSWGSADIYIGTEKKDKYDVKHNILSNGIYQFDIMFGKYDSRFPHDVMVDVHPKAKAGDAAYPFDIRREGFNHLIEKDVAALKAYIETIGLIEQVEDEAETFKSMKQLPRVKVNGLAMTTEQKEAVKDTVKKENAPVEKPQVKYDNLQVKDGVISTTDKTTGKTVILIDTNEGKDTDEGDGEGERKKAFDKSFDPDKKLKTAADMLHDIGIDPSQPVFHNNTNIDWMSFHPDAPEFFSQMGSLMSDLKEEIAKLGDYVSKAVKPDFYSGISIDKSYAGVNIKIPFSGMFINPFYVAAGVGTDFNGIVKSLYHTMLHEAVHFYVRAHNDSFASGLWTIDSNMATTGAHAKMTVKLEMVLKKHFEMYKEMKKEYDKFSTKNIRGSLEGERSESDESFEPELSDEQIEQRSERFWGKLWNRYANATSEPVVSVSNAEEGRKDSERLPSDKKQNQIVPDKQSSVDISKLSVGDQVTFRSGAKGFVVSVEDGKVTAVLQDGTFKELKAIKPKIEKNPSTDQNKTTLSVDTASAPAEPTDPVTSPYESLEDEEVHNMLINDINLPLQQQVQSGYGGTKVSSTDVINSFRKVLEQIGNTVIRMGRTGNIQAEGIYKPRVEVIRLGRANKITAAAHEVGHAIQKAVFGAVSGRSLGGLSPIVRRQLIDLGRELYGDRVPKGGYAAEGFAEFIRMALTGDTTTVNVSAVEDWYNNEFLPNNPELETVLWDARSTVDDYINQGAKSRSDANMPVKKSVKERLAGLRNFFRKIPTWMNEDLTPLLRLTRRVESITGLKLSFGEDPYSVGSALRGLAPSRVAYMAYENMVDANGNIVGRPLIDATQLVRDSERDFTHYLWARRTIELLDRTKTLDDGTVVPDPKASGMSREDAEFLISEFDTQYPQFEIAAQQVYDWNRGVLEYVRQMVPDLDESIQRVLDSSQNYVPLMRVFDDVEEDVLAGKYSGFGSNSLKTLKGSDRRVKSIFPQLLANAERLIQMAHKRKVLDTIVSLGEIDGVGQLIEEVPQSQRPNNVTIEQIARGLTDAGVDLDGIDLDQAITYFTPAQRPQGKDPIVPLVRDGAIRWYYVNAELYNTLSGLDIHKLHPILDWTFGVSTRAFRLGTTGLKASFSLFTNPMRDIPTLYMQTQTNNPARLVMEYFRAIGSALNPKRLVGENTTALDLVHRLGVSMSQPLGTDEAITTKASKELFKSPFKRVVTQPITMLRELLSTPEMIPREAEVRAIAKEIGYTIGTPMDFNTMVQLSLAGRRATVDFAAMGTVGRVMNQMIPFFNANIQGSRSFIRAYQARPVRTTLTGLAVMTLPTLWLWWKYKDEDWWRKMPTREKFQYWHFRVGDEVIQIPRTQDWGGVFASVPEALLDGWYQRDPKGVEKSMGYLFDNVTPDILPTIARAAVEQLGNRIDYFDRPIVPTGDLNKPAAEQYSPYTSVFAKWLGAHLPNWKVLNIPINSPRRIDALIRTMAGGVGSDLAHLLDISKKDLTLSDLPVIGRAFRQGGVEGVGSTDVENFYDALDEAKTRAASEANPESPQEQQQRQLLEDTSKTIAVVRKLAVEAPTVRERERYSRLVNALADLAVNRKLDYTTEQNRKLLPEDIDLLKQTESKIAEVTQVTGAFDSGKVEDIKELPKRDQREVLKEGLLTDQQQKFSSLTNVEKLFKFRVSTLEDKARQSAFITKAINDLKAKRDKQPNEQALIGELERAQSNFDAELSKQPEDERRRLEQIDDETEKAVSVGGRTRRRSRPAREGRPNKNDPLNKLFKFYEQKQN